MTSSMDFEQGPIRPPSEAQSLLVRVSRNCSWNRCAFCPVYKGQRHSRRSADEVIADLDAMQRLYSDAPRTVFLQDANPLIERPRDLIRIVRAIRERFPRVRRITAYARSRTLSRRSEGALTAIREAGLDRLHVGLESGADPVLALIDKGVSRAEQIEGGQKARAAGFELSEYVMPGLGGRALSALHAQETASALVAIRPHFVRLRTTTVIPGTPLAALVAAGRFEPLGERALVAEIRALLAGLEGLETRLESDHVMNLLMEIQGNLPADLGALLAAIDRFLSLSEREAGLFVLARRLGWIGGLGDLERPGALDAIARQLPPDTSAEDLEQLFAKLRARTI